MRSRTEPRLPGKDDNDHQGTVGQTIIEKALSTPRSRHLCTNEGLTTSRSPFLGLPCVPTRMGGIDNTAGWDLKEGEGLDNTVAGHTPLALLAIEGWTKD